MESDVTLFGGEVRSTRVTTRWQLQTNTNGETIVAGKEQVVYKQFTRVEPGAAELGM
jgi:hypothetical protein